jgi:hypothetical protein
MNVQVVADFIIEHSIDQNSDESCNLVSIHPWKLSLMVWYVERVEV